MRKQAWTGKAVDGMVSDGSEKERDENSAVERNKRSGRSKNDRQGSETEGGGVEEYARVMMARIDAACYHLEHVTAPDPKTGDETRWNLISKRKKPNYSQINKAVGRTNVVYRIREGKVQPPQALADLAAFFGEPLEDWYRDAGIPLPASSSPAPTDPIAREIASIVAGFADREDKEEALDYVRMRQRRRDARRPAT